MSERCNWCDASDRGALFAAVTARFIHRGLLYPMIMASSHARWFRVPILLYADAMGVYAACTASHTASPVGNAMLRLAQCTQDVGHMRFDGTLQCGRPRHASGRLDQGSCGRTLSGFVAYKQRNCLSKRKVMLARICIL